MRRDIIEVDVLIAPLEIVNDPLISQLLLDDENVLKEVDYPFFDIEVVELGNHSLLIFQILFVLVDQSISLVNYVSDVIKNSRVGAQVHLCQLVGQILVLLFFSKQLGIHVLNLMVVPFQFSHN